MKTIYYLLFVLSFSIQLNSQTIYVDINNTSSNQDGQSWSTTYTSIITAINNSTDGNEIHIAEGIYIEGEINIFSTYLTLKGGYPTGGGTQDILNNFTALDGGGLNRVLYISQNAGTVTLDGLTIQNGYLSQTTGPYGGGIRNNGNLTLTNCNVINNSTYASDRYSYGGGIHSSGILNLINCNISNNSSTADYRYVYGSGIHSSGTLNATNTTISN